MAELPQQIIYRRVAVIVNISDLVLESRCNMKEFVKNLIERLDKERIYFSDPGDSRYNRGLCRAKEIVNQLAEEYNNGWIPCSERLPEEHDSIFAKSKGTDNWNDAMFEKVSDVVNVTIVDENGKRATTHAHTTDGKWSCDLLRCNKTYRIIAWRPLPYSYQPKGGQL